MKKHTLLSLFLGLFLFASAQVELTVNTGWSSGGRLGSLLSLQQRQTVTSLIVEGFIDARDIELIRDSLPLLAHLDLTETTIQGYTGTGYNQPVFYPANTLYSWSFANRLSLVSVKLPKELVEIGDYCFSECENLKSVQFLSDDPNLADLEWLKKVGIGAFYKCKSLEKLIFPGSVDSVGYQSLFELSSLREITLPRGLTSMKMGQLSFCDSLRYLVIPNKVKKIESSAIINNHKLDTLVLGAGVELIDTSSIFQLVRLRVVYSLNPTPPVILNAVNNEQFGAFAWAGELMPNRQPPVIKVPTSSIAAYQAANGWSRFTIQSCEELINNTVAGQLQSSIPPGLDLAKILCLKVTGVLNRDDIATINTTMPRLMELDLSEATIEGGRIDTSAFEENRVIARIKLPQNLQTIGWSAFFNCRQLDSVAIPPSVSRIDDYAFYNTSIRHATIPALVDTVGHNAFQSCKFLVDVDFTNPLTKLKSGIFTESNIQKVALPAQLSDIQDWTFQQCWQLKSITLPSTITSIGAMAFYDCKELSGKIVIPDLVEEINNSAFERCNKVDTLILGNSLRNVKTYAFLGCNNIKHIDFPATMDSIGRGNFGTCQLSGSLIIPSGTSFLGEDVFENNPISSLTLPASLTFIDHGAFRNCTALRDIYSYNPTPPTIPGTGTFSGVPRNLCTLHISATSEAAYRADPYWSTFLISVDPVTGINQNNNDYKVFTSDGMLTVEGLTKDKSIRIYSIDGALVYKARSSSDTFTKQLKTGRFYVLCIDNKIYKLAL